MSQPAEQVADAKAPRNQPGKGRVDMRAFRRVRNEKNPEDTPAENEVRVTTRAGTRTFVASAISLLKGTDEKVKQSTIKIIAMGSAISIAVSVAGVVKRRVKGIHQQTDLGSRTMMDKYEGIDSDKTMEVERKVSTIVITLSTQPLDTKHIGYQPPLPESEVKEGEDVEVPRGPRRGGDGDGERRGRGRGGRGRGRGRGGRGRGGRGGDRGGGRGGDRGQ